MTRETGARQLPALRLEMFIDGAFVKGAGAALAVENPATEQTIATFAQASVEQVDLAVAAARKAFNSGVWKDREFRASVLHKLADLLQARAEEFISIIVEEMGTPISICRFLQIDTPIQMLRFVADRARHDWTRSLGRNSQPPASESLIRYQPLGVVAGIGAYNNHLLYIASKSCAALAAGCTSVFLPSPLTPLAALKFGELLTEAGIPPGVFNIIVGDAQTGRALSEHRGIDKVSFTGSVAVGRQIMQQAAANLTGVVLELGGKSAGIVLPNADLAKIALPLHGRYIRNAGQGCQSPTRLLVPASRYDDFIDISRETYTKIPIGDPWEPATMAGPLITEAHRARVEAAVLQALHNGGSILAGGGRPNMAHGWYMNAALIGGLSNDAEIAREELFAPVAVVIPYRDVEHAIAIANDSNLGLAASVFGPLDEAQAVAERIDVGSVYINGGGNFRPDSVISGWKDSGVGAEWGDDGIREFLAPKHIQWTI